MAGIKLNARDMIIEISNGAVTPVWTEVEGLTKFNYKPDENEEMVDTTTFSSDGNYEGEKMQIGASAEVEGFLIKDSESGVQAPGQAAVELAAVKLGPESVSSFRFRHFLDTEWKVWRAVPTLGEQGGENNDKTSWSATLMRSGPSATVAVA